MSQVAERSAMSAVVFWKLTDEHGNIKQSGSGHNLITDAGDQNAADRLYDDTVNIVTGMKLGTGTTAGAKNGAGAAMVTYITGSEGALDATATSATKGAGLGWRTTYVCTWAAGVATNSAIAEICLTFQTALADNTSAEADTFARFVFSSTINKQAGDELVVTWNVDALGA